MEELLSFFFNIAVYILSIQKSFLITIPVLKYQRPFYYRLTCLKYCWMANSVAFDQTSQKAASDLGLHCLRWRVCPNT